MLAFLGRYEKKTERVAAVVCGNTVRLSGDTAKSTDFESGDAALAELERFIARKQKAGFVLHHRLASSPWIAWVDELERMWSRVVSNAKALNVPCDTKVGQSYFQRT